MEPPEVVADDAVVLRIGPDRHVGDRPLATESAIEAIEAKSLPRLPVKAVPEFRLIFDLALWIGGSDDPFLGIVLGRQRLEPVLSFRV